MTQVQKIPLLLSMNAQELAQLQMPHVRAWIAAHSDQSPLNLAMKGAPHGIPAALAIGQIALLQKAAIKLPTWSRHCCILPARAYEQATSEALARAKPWRQGRRALDLSCGLGSDDAAIAARYDHVTALEPDPVLAEIVRFNQQLMGITNVELLQMRAEDFLNRYSGPNFDLIYIDPDRRDAQGKRQFGLRDCQPDVLSLLPKMLQIGRRILIKASPMLDVQAVIAEIGIACTIWVTAEGNECKELLIEIDPENNGQTVGRAVLFLRKSGVYAFKGEAGGPQSIWSETASPPYILEADTALYKARLTAAWFEQANSEYVGGMIGAEGYYFSDQDFPTFHGHRFRVIAQMEFKPELIRKYCKANHIPRIQYTRRDFDVPIEQVRQQVKVPEGGSLFLLLTRMGKLGRMAFVAERLV